MHTYIAIIKPEAELAVRELCNIAYATRLGTAFAIEVGSFFNGSEWRAVRGGRKIPHQYIQTIAHVVG